MPPPPLPHHRMPPKMPTQETILKLSRPILSPPRDPFRSTRLHYRALNPTTDLRLFAAINGDPSGYANSNLSNIHLPTAADAAQFQASVIENSLVAAIICLPGGDDDADGGIAIGQIHLKRGKPGTQHHRNTEIGIDILPEYQRKGYGSEAIQWVLDYAFRRAGLHRVMIRAFGWNEGAIRLYEQLGFKHEARHREALWHEGRWWDSIDMAMLEGESWEGKKNGVKDGIWG
ncbi:acyl-CoA N-acyltransferase [Massariosphaeria phaeospora]|uniref:Acyl-CoA N-acyltransferase n=1 Tax=Massariosphaeria phaeospora TaxID=100035 RepID=A0A7C8MF93_9PLEO|nr:acyl-CoA N-acyltransferase [Massariosphaeria phaeospora]